MKANVPDAAYAVFLALDSAAEFNEALEPGDEPSDDNGYLIRFKFRGVKYAIMITPQ